MTINYRLANALINLCITGVHKKLIYASENNENNLMHMEV
jgi:hypothetical protein